MNFLSDTVIGCPYVFQPSIPFNAVATRIAKKHILLYLDSLFLSTLFGACFHVVGAPKIPTCCHVQILRDNQRVLQYTRENRGQLITCNFRSKNAKIDRGN